MADPITDRLNQRGTTAPVVAQTPLIAPTMKKDPITLRLESLGSSTLFTPKAVPTEPEVNPLDYSKQTYSESDLVKDEYFYPIQEYMIDRYGTHMRDQDRDETVSQYVNNMRGFAGGNSWRSVQEIMYLNNKNDNPDSMAKAGQAYELFNNMQGLGGETGWGEKGAIFWDYTRSAVADPVNLLGGIIGKVAGGAGSRVTSMTAMYAAKRVFEKKLIETGSKKIAAELAQKSLAADASRVAAKVAAKTAERQAIVTSSTNTLQRMTSKVALKEAAIQGGIESLASMGTDYLYQDAMLRTLVQDDYNIYQTGLMGVAGLVSGGLFSMVSNARTGTSEIVSPNPFKTTTKGANVISKLVNQTGSVPPGPPGTVSPPMGNWLKDISKGVELRDQDNEFFVKMMLGDKTKGLKGLGSILAEDGYGWVSRGEDDKISNWIGDIIKESDPQDAKKFMDDFVTATGITMDDGKALTLESFANTFKKKMSDSGIILNGVSQLAALLGRDAKTITGDEFVSWQNYGILPESAQQTTRLGTFLNKHGGQLVNRDIPNFQDNVIKLMVSNLATTQLNIAGFSMATSMNSATDITRALIIGGRAAIALVTNPTGAKELGISAMSLIQNQVVKFKNLLDINMTYDAFLAYAKVRPGSTAKLTQMGFTNTAISKEFDPTKPLWTQGGDIVVDFLGTASLNPAQDSYTKGFEFMSQINKEISRPVKEGGFGMSYNNFMKQPNHHELMLTEEYMHVEARAIDETLRATFSKSYNNPATSLGKLAGFIEDARNIPGIGLLVPFGKFFNNQIAMASNMTAVGPILSKILGGQKGKTSDELAARGLVAFGMFWAVSDIEMANIDKGLGVFEEIDPSSGEVLDQQYAFPYGAIKAIGRVIALIRRGDEVPYDLKKQITNTYLGQLTRGLSSSGQGVGAIAEAFMGGDGLEVVQVLSDSLGSIPSQVVSAATRPLEPLNALAGLARKEGYYTPDRKQGFKLINQSTRYIDQVVALATGRSPGPQAYNTSEGKVIPQPTRLISPNRTTVLTSTEQVLNAVGRQGWPKDMRSDSPEANNRYNQIFREIIESGSRKLWDSPQFKSRNLEYKQGKVDKLYADAKKATLSYMKRVGSNSGDSTLVKMIEVSLSTSDLEIKRVLKDLGYTKSIEDMNFEELTTLENAIKVREDWINRIGQ